MTAVTNPLSFNSWVQQVGVLAVAPTQLVSGVEQFVDPPLQQIVPMILAYAELRMQRDLDLLPSQTSNIYTLTAGQQLFSIPVDDFLIVQTVEYVQVNGGTVVNATPLLPVSKEFIQNVYGGLQSASAPQYFAMYGDNFEDGGDTNTNVIFGPTPSYAFNIRVTGTCRLPSLYTYASAGPADTSYTYISSYYQDMLLMASMIYVSAFQRNFSSTSDDAAMGMTYEKQYQALRASAVMEENRKKAMGSGWTPYSTPVSATATR